MAEVQAGMQVARDVKSSNGMVLVTAGTELTDVHIRSLQKWHVDIVEVKIPDGGAHGEGDAHSKADLEELERQEDRINYLFSGIADEQMETLRTAMLRYYRELLGSGTG